MEDTNPPGRAAMGRLRREALTEEPSAQRSLALAAAPLPPAAAVPPPHGCAAGRIWSRPGRPGHPPNPGESRGPRRVALRPWTPAFAGDQGMETVGRQPNGKQRFPTIDPYTYRRDSRRETM